MLERADLSLKMSKEEYDNVVDGLRVKLGSLQRQAREANVPILITVNGWEAAGKSEVINHLIRALDPRGFRVYPIIEPNDEERARPFFWRFWLRTPASGSISILQNSWYGRSIVERLTLKKRKDDYFSSPKSLAYIEEINDFERQLSDEGTLVIKLFLHIGKKEQKKRFDKLDKDPEETWSITNVDRDMYRHYEEYYELFDTMLKLTDTASVPWHVVEAEDRQYAWFRSYDIIIDAIEKRLAEQKQPAQEYTNSIPIPSMLDQVRTDRSLDKDEYKTRLDECQKRLGMLQWSAYNKGLPTVIVFEGMDAAGKGGGIMRLAESLDPRGYKVIPISAPEYPDSAHHYLWRFWKEIPAKGLMTIFDRSWYGRVLVERVEGLVEPDVWRRAYDEINQLERSIQENGTLIIKFWLHIDKDTQLKRFEERMSDANKTWKITGDDWRNRLKWDDYKAAVDEMLYRTNTRDAPWTIVESNDKYYSRIKILQTVIDSMEKAIK